MDEIEIDDLLNDLSSSVSAIFDNIDNLRDEKVTEAANSRIVDDVPAVPAGGVENLADTFQNVSLDDKNNVPSVSGDDDLVPTGTDEERDQTIPMKNEEEQEEEDEEDRKTPVMDEEADEDHNIVSDYVQASSIMEQEDDDEFNDAVSELSMDSVISVISVSDAQFLADADDEAVTLYEPSNPVNLRLNHHHHHRRDNHIDSQTVVSRRVVPLEIETDDEPDLIDYMVPPPIPPSQEDDGGEDEEEMMTADVSLAYNVLGLNDGAHALSRENDLRDVIVTRNMVSQIALMISRLDEKLIQKLVRKFKSRNILMSTISFPSTYDLVNFNAQTESKNLQRAAHQFISDWETVWETYVKTIHLKLREIDDIFKQANNVVSHMKVLDLKNEEVCILYTCLPPQNARVFQFIHGHYAERLRTKLNMSLLRYAGIEMRHHLNLWSEMIARLRQSTNEMVDGMCEILLSLKKEVLVDPAFEPSPANYAKLALEAIQLNVAAFQIDVDEHRQQLVILIETFLKDHRLSVCQDITHILNQIFKCLTCVIIEQFKFTAATEEVTKKRPGFLVAFEKRLNAVEIKKEAYLTSLEVNKSLVEKSPQNLLAWFSGGTYLPNFTVRDYQIFNLFESAQLTYYSVAHSLVPHQRRLLPVPENHVMLLYGRDSSLQKLAVNNTLPVYVQLDCPDKNVQTVSARIPLLPRMGRNQLRNMLNETSLSSSLKRYLMDVLPTYKCAKLGNTDYYANETYSLLYNVNPEHYVPLMKANYLSLTVMFINRLSVMSLLSESKVSTSFIYDYHQAVHNWFAYIQVFYKIFTPTALYMAICYESICLHMERKLSDFLNDVLKLRREEFDESHLNEKHFRYQGVDYLHKCSIVDEVSSSPIATAIGAVMTNYFPHKGLCEMPSELVYLRFLSPDLTLDSISYACHYQWEWMFMGKCSSFNLENLTLNAMSLILEKLMSTTKKYSNCGSSSSYKLPFRINTLSESNMKLWLNDPHASLIETSEEEDEDDRQDELQLINLSSEESVPTNLYEYQINIPSDVSKLEQDMLSDLNSVINTTMKSKHERDEQTLEEMRSRLSLITSSINILTDRIETTSTTLDLNSVLGHPLPSSSSSLDGDQEGDELVRLSRLVIRMEEACTVLLNERQQCNEKINEIRQRMEFLDIDEDDDVVIQDGVANSLVIRLEQLTEAFVEEHIKTKTAHNKVSDLLTASIASQSSLKASYNKLLAEREDGEEKRRRRSHKRESQWQRNRDIEEEQDDVENEEEDEEGSEEKDDKESLAELEDLKKRLREADSETETLEQLFEELTTLYMRQLEILENWVQERQENAQDEFETISRQYEDIQTRHNDLVSNKSLNGSQNVSYLEELRHALGALELKYMDLSSSHDTLQRQYEDHTNASIIGEDMTRLKQLLKDRVPRDIDLGDDGSNEEGGNERQTVQEVHERFMELNTRLESLMTPEWFSSTSPPPALSELTTAHKELEMKCASLTAELTSVSNRCASLQSLLDMSDSGDGDGRAVLLNKIHNEESLNKTNEAKLNVLQSELENAIKQSTILSAENERLKDTQVEMDRCKKQMEDQQETIEELQNSLEVYARTSEPLYALRQKVSEEQEIKERTIEHLNETIKSLQLNEENQSKLQVELTEHIDRLTTDNTTLSSQLRSIKLDFEKEMRAQQETTITLESMVKELKAQTEMLKAEKELLEKQKSGDDASGATGSSTTTESGVRNKTFYTDYPPDLTVDVVKEWEKFPDLQAYISEYSKTNCGQMMIDVMKTKHAKLIDVAKHVMSTVSKTAVSSFSENEALHKYCESIDEIVGSLDDMRILNVGSVEETSIKLSAFKYDLEQLIETLREDGFEHPESEEEEEEEEN